MEGFKGESREEKMKQGMRRANDEMIVSRAAARRRTTGKPAPSEASTAAGDPSDAATGDPSDMAAEEMAAAQPPG